MHLMLTVEIYCCHRGPLQDYPYLYTLSDAIDHLLSSHDFPFFIASGAQIRGQAKSIESSSRIALYGNILVLVIEVRCLWSVW
jgi:hypothetical protein